MFLAEGGRPGDQRGFVHKKLLGIGAGIVKRFVPPVSIGLDALRVGRRLFGRPPARRISPRTTTARPSLESAAGKETGRALKFGGDVSLPSAGFAPDRITSFAPPRRRGLPFGGGTGGGGTRPPCDFPMVRDSQGRCRTPTSGEFGGEQFGVGEAVMGRYGAALEPGSMIIDRAVCLRGMQLGDDGLCYNKGNITNKQRMWPRGRRPLLTGGDMRAIGIAARAGSKLERTTKRLRGLGMMKALPKGRGPPRAHAHAKPVAAVSV